MDYATEFVNQFCNKLAILARAYRSVSSWYVFEDKRPGTIEERFTLDAADHAAYQKLFQP